jgi:hypothetical protein
MHTYFGNSMRSAGYSCLMEKLVSSWREQWSSEPGTTVADAPFGVVTLAPSGGEGGADLPTMRWAQTASYGENSAILPRGRLVTRQGERLSGRGTRCVTFHSNGICLYWECMLCGHVLCVAAGVLPNPSMPNTFIAQAFDLDDPFSNITCYKEKCCDNNFNLTFCNRLKANAFEECKPYCAAGDATNFYM